MSTQILTLHLHSCLTEHSAETALLKVTNDLQLAQFSGLIFALFDLRVHSALDSLEHSLPEIQSHFDFFNFGLFFFSGFFLLSLDDFSLLCYKILVFLPIKCGTLSPLPSLHFLSYGFHSVTMSLTLSQTAILTSPVDCLTGLSSISCLKYNLEFCLPPNLSLFQSALSP